MNSRNITYQETITMVTEQCISCGVIFGLPSDLRHKLVNNRNSFYCPNGHSMHFTGETKAEKLEKQLKEEKQKNQKELENLQDRLLDEMNAKNLAEKKLKRVVKGVCPCCNRTFANLASHMKTKHKQQLNSK